MHRTRLLSLLRCPENHSELTPAADSVIRKINDAIRARKLFNRGGRIVDTFFEAGLVRQAGDILYPIDHGIPLLLRDEGIELNQLQPEHAINSGN